MRITAEEPTRVLVADADRENRISLIDTLSSCGIFCVEATDGVSALSHFTAENPDLILAALQLPGLPALDLLNRVREVSTTPFVVQVPAGELAAAITAIRSGAADVIPLPCDAHELPVRIRAAIATDPDHRSRDGLSAFAGRSSATTRIREQIRALAGLRIPVLFRGEKGSGRDHAARWLAQLDGIPTSDVLKFAPATGVHRTRNDVSKTVYLDEIELHPRVDQAYWTERILESERAAANAPRRILVSTTSDLEGLSRRNEMDSKLAKTLLRFVVNIPPLRERSEDVIPLSQCLSLKASRQIGRPRVTFTGSALNLLQQQPWPGNVSQLAAVIEKLVAFSPNGLIT